MTKSKTDTEILNDILIWANKYAGEVAMHQDDFFANDYAGGNIDDAWEGGFQDGTADAANDILSIIASGRGE